MTIDRPRLQRIANQKSIPAYQIPLCRHCGQSSSFVWDFSATPPTKTCREPSCGATDVVGRFDTKKEVANYE